MGKKYIVEIGRLERLYKASISAKGMPNMTWLSPEVDLTPYTEPNLERVKKEAYDKGYHDGYFVGDESWKDIVHEKEEEFYQKGLSDAWEAARKIANMPYEDGEKIFGVGGWHIIEKCTAAEVIEKLKAHEQEKEQDKFHVGDEFENESGKKFVVLKMNGKEIDRYIDVDGKTYCMTVKYKGMRKTGRHFPEVAAVLEKMRGESND